MVQALVTSFEEASRKTYADPAFAKEVARKEFPDLPGEVVDKAIDAELKYLIPAQSVMTKQDQWKNLMDMQVYLGNVEGIGPVRGDHRQFLCRQGGRQPEMSGVQAARPSRRRAAPAARPSADPAAGRRAGVARATTIGGKIVPVIGDLSLTLASGEIVSIVGPSGCGKTTLLNVAVRPDRARRRARSAGTAASWPGSRRTSATCCRRTCCCRGARRSAT